MRKRIRISIGIVKPVRTLQMGSKAIGTTLNLEKTIWYKTKCPERYRIFFAKRLSYDKPEGWTGTHVVQKSFTDKDAFEEYYPTLVNMMFRTENANVKITDSISIISTRKKRMFKVMKLDSIRKKMKKLELMTKDKDIEGWI